MLERKRVPVTTATAERRQDATSGDLAIGGVVDGDDMEAFFMRARRK